MLMGVCPYCNCQRFGLALLDPKYHICPECGVGRMVVNSNHKPTEGYQQLRAVDLGINPGNKPSAEGRAPL